MKIKTPVLVSIFIAYLLLGLSAQGEVRIVKAARMLDVESGKMVSPAVIVVDGDRIQSINPKELPSQVERGMKPIESIRGATLYAADLLGVDDRGFLSKGRFADLIAVEANPLEDITTLQSVRFVMKGGVVYKQP